MTKPKRKCVVLMADDDADDREFMKDAFESVGLPCKFQSVENGKDVLDYLHGESKYHDKAQFPRPDLILLDLNMPLMDGFETLRKIRSDEQFKLIPVVIVSTSNDPHSIYEGYNIGANAFVSKPASFDGFLNAVEGLRKFWIDVAELPPRKDASNI